MDELRKLVIGLATLSDSDLRDMRQRVESMDGPEAAKNLVLNLIDLYIRVGDDPKKRAEAAAACLVAIDRIDKGQGAGVFGGSSGSSGGKKKGCLSMILLVVSLGACAAMWLR